MKLKTVTSLVAIGAFALSAPAFAQSDLRDSIAADYDENLEALFTHFHQNPELSHREFKTAEYIAEHLENLGLEVQTGIAHTGCGSSTPIVDRLSDAIGI